MSYLNEIKFVEFKENIFGPNKYLFKSNEFFFKIKKQCNCIWSEI